MVRYRLVIKRQSVWSTQMRLFYKAISQVAKQPFSDSYPLPGEQYAVIVTSIEIFKMLVTLVDTLGIQITSAATITEEAFDPHKI